MFKKVLLILACVLSISFICYFNASKINTKQFKVREEILENHKIDEDVDGLIIAYFTDLYYGSFLDRQYLDNFFNTINDFKPDIIIFGGDLIDFENYKKLSEEEKEYLNNSLKNLKAKYGKYSILGEYDYQNIDLVYSIYSLSDFNVLNNTNQLISIDKNSFINIVGIDCLIDDKANVPSSFLGANLENYTLVVSHCPDIYDDLSTYDYDYLLSGHSRGGQIYFPIINLFTRPVGAEKYFSGKITRNGKTLDISSGVGRIKTNARFNADAELVFYTIKRLNIQLSDK